MTFVDKWKRDFGQVRKGYFWTILGFTATTPWRKKRLELITYETLLCRG